MNSTMTMGTCFNVIDWIPHSLVFQISFSTLKVQNSGNMVYIAICEFWSLFPIFPPSYEASIHPPTHIHTYTHTRWTLTSFSSEYDAIRATEWFRILKYMTLKLPMHACTSVFNNIECNLNERNFLSGVVKLEG